MDANKTWDMIQRMMNGQFTADEDHWVTINGAHVLIGEGGEVKGGPDGVKQHYAKKSGGRSGRGGSESQGSWKPDDIYNDKGFVGHRYIENQAEEYLELKLPDNDEELDTIFESRVVGKPDETGRADVEVDYRVRTASGKLEERTSTINALVSSTKAKGSSLKSDRPGAKNKSGASAAVTKMSDKELRAAISESDRISRNENWSKMSDKEKAASRARRNQTHEMRKELDRRGAAAEKANGIKGGFGNAKSGSKKTRDSAWEITECMMVGDFNPNHDPDDGRFTSGSGGSSGSNNEDDENLDWYKHGHWDHPDDIFEDLEDEGFSILKHDDKSAVVKGPNSGQEYELTFTGSLDKKYDIRIGEVKKRAASKGDKPASGGKMKDPVGYFSQASKMSGLKPILDQMNKASKDSVSKAVYKAAASPDGGDTTLQFGRKSVKVTAPSKEKRVAKQYGIHWTDRRGIPNASYYGEARDLATHLLITLKDLGYKGEQITIK